MKRVCLNNGRFKELAYLNIKMAKIEDAVNVLIDNCGEDLSSVADFAVAFNI